MKLRKYYYSICLGIGLNMVIPEFKEFGLMETEVNRNYH